MSSTKTCYLDANVLVYLKDVTAQRHEKTQALIEKLILNSYTLYISPLCIDEFLHAVTLSLRKMQSQYIERELKRHLASILTMPNLILINPPKTKRSQLRIITLMTKFSLRPRDAYHLLTMKINKIKYFATFDNDFDKVFEKGVLKRFVE